MTLANFERSIRERPEVMECYLMTGDADYLLGVVIPDLPAFERFTLDHLTKIKGIASIKSSFALKQVKYQTALPLHVTPSSLVKKIASMPVAGDAHRRTRASE